MTKISINVKYKKSTLINIKLDVNLIDNKIYYNIIGYYKSKLSYITNIDDYDIQYKGLYNLTEELKIDKTGISREGLLEHVSAYVDNLTIEDFKFNGDVIIN